jgi:4-amino-4-deoxy-L-arabinose transferase-like glycosyltransferase
MTTLVVLRYLTQPCHSELVSGSTTILDVFMKYKYYLISFSVLFILFSIFLYKNVSHIKPHQDIDSSAYLVNAQRFYQTNSFVDPANPKAIPYYALGYAFFIGLVYKIFGVSNFYVIWLQVLLALLTGFLIFGTTRLLFNKKTALISFILFSLNVGFLTFSQFILTEVLLAFLYTLFLYLFVLFMKKQKLLHLVFSCLILGLSVAVKPAALYFIFFLILFVLLFLENKLKHIILICISFYLPITGYMLFNKIAYNNFAVAPLGNENFYFYFFPKVLAKEKGSDYLTEKAHLSSLLTGEKMEAQSWNKIKELFISHLKKNPILFVRVWLQNVAKTLFGLFTTNLKVLVEPGLRGGDVSFFKTEGSFVQRIWGYIAAGTLFGWVKAVGVLEGLWTILRYILCLIALIFLLLKKRWATIFLLISFVFYFSMITGHDGCARFRMMFESALIILASPSIYLLFFKKCEME